MQPPSNQDLIPRRAPLERRRFRPLRFGVWLVAALVAAACLAWFSTKVSARFAPILLLPIGLGILLGLLLSWGMRIFEVAHPSSLLAGSLFAAAMLVVGQHYVPYHQWRSHAPSGAESLAAQVFPEMQTRLHRQDATFSQFLREEADRGMEVGEFQLGSRGMWLLWGISAALTLGSTATIVFLAVRRPYCDRCGSWYRVSRCGNIPIAKAAELATRLGWSDHKSAAAYRFWTCRGCCGSSGCELSWKHSGLRPQFAWVDRAGMAAITQSLDTN